MTKYLFPLLILLFLTPAISAQPDNTNDFYVGEWEIKFFGTPNGDGIMHANLVRQDDQLTGTLTDPSGQGEPRPLTKIEEKEEGITLYFTAQGFDANVDMKRVSNNKLNGTLMNMFKATMTRMKDGIVLEAADETLESDEPDALGIMGWDASWISGADISPKGYGVYYFRKGFELTAVPSTFPIRVSADNKYKLFVNEQLVSIGPARADLLHWNYETVDLAPFLQTGKNVVAAQVWNEGEHTPLANVSDQTGFILMGETKAAKVLNTNDSWKYIQDKSYAPIQVNMNTYYVAGPGEFMDRHQTIEGWNSLAYDDSKWAKTKAIAPGYEKYRVGFGQPTPWMLVPSELPPMELTYQRFNAVRKAAGVNIPSGFPVEKSAITFPANTESILILDQSFLTNAYVTLNFSAGENSSITLDYAEALFSNFPEKGNRDEIEGKVFIGRRDSLISNGKTNQEFTTLAFRTYRYVQLTVKTKAEALILNDIYGTFTGYPFELNAKLETEDSSIKEIFDVGWRTARLCAYDTYMDCPYYEQLQYIGDGRIQALVSLYNSGDDRLVKNFITQIDYSREPEGVTMSRYPTAQSQYIPPFSLWYIGVVYDYMKYGKDVDFVKSKLLGVRSILSYFQKFQQSDGRLKHLPWWNFTDWVEQDPNWVIGIRKPGADGSSALMDLPLLLAYQMAAEMEQSIGLQEMSTIYTQKAAQLKAAIQNKYWVESKGLFADNAEQNLFSQHTNALAILTEAAPKEKWNKIAEQLLSDTQLAPASIYFKYYLHQALAKAGYGNDYLDWLDKWKENIAMGMTTWSEDSNINTTRSDCHAWGSSPNIEFFRILLGIDSDAPGFSKIKIEPHLGDIKEIGGEMPHPNGKIKVSYKVTQRQLETNIVLPPNTSGTFIWKGKGQDLKEGENHFFISL